MAIYEILSGTSNVVRFPVEERARPSLELMRDLRPDVRIVLANADAFGFDPPSPLVQENVDRETAAHIASETPKGERPSAAFLDGLLEPLVKRAVTLARETLKAQRDVAEAQRRTAQAQQAGHPDAGWLAERAMAAASRETELSLIAHHYAEEAEGVARAVRLAREGVAWTPRDHAAETDEFLDMAIALRRRQSA